MSKDTETRSQYLQGSVVIMGLAFAVSVWLVFLKPPRVYVPHRFESAIEWMETRTGALQDWLDGTPEYRTVRFLHKLAEHGMPASAIERQGKLFRVRLYGREAFFERDAYGRIYGSFIENRRIYAQVHALGGAPCSLADDLVSLLREKRMKSVFQKAFAGVCLWR